MHRLIYVIFRVKKSHISLRDIFWDTLYIIEYRVALRICAAPLCIDAVADKNNNLISHEAIIEQQTITDE